MTTTEADPAGEPDRIGRGLFYRCGVTAARHHGKVLLLWSVAVLCGLILLPFLLARMGPPPLLVYGSESARTNDAVARSLPFLGNEQFLLVFRSQSMTADDPVYRQTVRTALEALARQPGVTGALTLPDPTKSPGAPTSNAVYSANGFPYRDPHNMYGVVGVVGNEWELARRFPAQRAAAEQAVAQTAGDVVHVYLVGRSPIYHDLRRVELDEARRVEAVSTVLAVVVLAVGLGVLGTAVVSLTMAGATIAVTLGAFALLGRVMHCDILLLTLVSVVGLGVSIDYSLLVVNRYREELNRGADRIHAAGVAVATAGATVYFAGLVVVASVLGLALIRIPAIDEFIVGMASVIVVALVAVLTLLPVLLVLCTPLLERGVVPGRRGSSLVLSDEGVWARWARRLMRRPWPILIGVALFLIACAAPTLDMRLGVDIQRATLARTLSGQGMTVFEHDSFGGATGVTTVLVRGPADAQSARADALVQALRADPDVTSVITIGGRDATAILAIPHTAVDSPRTFDLIHRIRGEIVPHTAMPGTSALVGGTAAILVDGLDEISAKTLPVIAVVLGISFVLLIAAFGSLVLPLKAIVLNLLTLAATYGLVVAVFQWGGGAAILGFTSSGMIQAYLPLVIFVIVFGLSLDYEMFLVGRMKEIYRRTGDNTGAVAVGLQRTARPIVLAAAVIVVAASGLLTSNIPELKQSGFALMAAILIDVTLIRLILVPVAMQVLGRWNWWLPHPRPRRADKGDVAVTATTDTSTARPKAGDS
ncbi:MMPL family transporter [Nocardia arthritidis]|uniref:MMPL family transporter n=1 Tax=Nocardia arthritidis TaxID=228602 RepID=A0A6G9YKB6_9NOCA|nr:MMPL family transporter [Nocardia arthritidis]QIS13600.1 MMPL family transporter [Nocardia arthritidis]